MSKGFIIAGTDTDVGKTIITASFLKAFIKKGFKTAAIKPVQTGCFKDDKNILKAPDVEEYKKAVPHINSPSPIYSFLMPSSPHIAGKLEKNTISTQKILEFCDLHLKNNEITLIEGAGGIFTPLNNETNYLDLIKQLDLPVILTANNCLGMINHTCLTIETLEMHGIKVCALIINNTKNNNNDIIKTSNIKYLKNKYSYIKTIEIPFINESKTDKISKILIENKLEQFIENNNEEIKETPGTLWHPYTSALDPSPQCVVSKTKGNYLFNNKKPILDGMSSWWCAVHGYNNENIRKAAVKQINQMPHVMFGGITHPPAIKLSESLLKILPKNLNKIFYADSGSVSVEVALKMAVQYWQGQNKLKKTKIMTVKGGYHGDTLGAMSVCDPENGMHTMFNDILPKQIFAPKPKARFDKHFKQEYMEDVRKLIKENHKQTAAFIIEPIVQGAGGMWFYHPKYLKELSILCKKYNILLILDEIATGFGRTGKLFACEWADIVPDIMCIGKAITGGTMSFAAACTTTKVANTISQNGGVLMHGPTFMGNPLACAVAHENIKVLLNSSWKKNVADIEKNLKKELFLCRELENVKDVRVLGAIGVVEVNENIDQNACMKFFIENNVWIRPFRNLVYIMPPYTITPDEIKTLGNTIYKLIKTQAYKRN